MKKIVTHLGPKEIDAAIEGILNFPREKETISLEEFKKILTISQGHKSFPVKWLQERGFLEVKITRSSGTAKKVTIVALTEKGTKLREEHPVDILDLFKILNEEYRLV